MRIFILAATAAAMLASPALAVTNLINNGSFEAAGTTGPNAFTSWTRSNTPANSPAIVINYNSTASYANGGAFGESVPADTVANSASPDAVGSRAAYFIGDFSVNETISQQITLTPGNYRIGFSFYLPRNGLANIGNSSLSLTLQGVQIVPTSAVTSASTGGTWFYASGVGQVVTGGLYTAALSFSFNRSPSKDIVVDRVFAVSTTDAADVLVPIPEPSSWAMMLAGFGLVGFSMRRRRGALVAAA